LLVALGSCAAFGGIPALANLASREEIFSRAYLDNPSIEPGNQTLPRPLTNVNGYQLTLPVFDDRVRRLQDLVTVDYVVPGCPPAPAQVRAVLTALASGTLPPRGSVVGASDRAICEECIRLKSEKRVESFRRPWQLMADPERCLLEQGILCAGSVTRSGCGVRCPSSGMPCRGCYGPLPAAADQGAKLVSAVASILDHRTADDIDAALADVPDVAGYAYRFALTASLLQRTR
jgi:F420-non-reducing hydrogenase small subunit